MAYPRSAVGRIILPITTSARLHRLHLFVRNPQIGGLTYRINSRTLDQNDTNWESAAQGWWDSIRTIFFTAVAAPTAELWTRVGLVWTLVSTLALANAGTNAGAVQLAAEITVTYRCSNGKFLRCQWFETSYTPPSGSRDINAPGGALTLTMKQWTSLNTVAYAPYIWNVNQDNQYLNASSFVKYVMTYNRKLRKLRGLS